MEPIAVLVMIAHIIKLYIMMLIPTIKSTIQTMIGLDLGRNGPYLNIRVSTDVMITILNFCRILNELKMKLLTAIFASILSLNLNSKNEITTSYLKQLFMIFNIY